MDDPVATTPEPLPPVTPSARQRMAGVFGPGTDGMPPWIPRLLRQIVLIALLFLAGLTVLRELRGFLVLLAISFFLAVALEPGVAFLAARGWRRGWATGAIFLVVGTVVGTFIGLMIPLVVDQLTKLVGRLPGYVDQTAEFLSGFGIDISQERLSQLIADLDTVVRDVATRLAGGIFGVGTRVLTTVFQGLTIALFTFYMTADGPTLRRSILSMMPPEHQKEVLAILEVAIEKTGGYFYSRALLAAVSSTATWTALTVIGIPFPLPLALWVGILSQFVPVVGTYIGGILPVVIALLESPIKALWVVIFIVLYQQFENYVISPRITAHTMSLHPAVAFGAAIVGGTLLGAPGAIMALPVAATAQASIATYLERHQLVESRLLEEQRRLEKEGSRRRPRHDPDGSVPADPASP